jgi:hypothetical protein
MAEYQRNTNRRIDICKMKFKLWLENMPETASAEVQRTGLQPQVDAASIDTMAKRDDDKLHAIDASIERFAAEIPDGDSDDPKINKFKKLWDKFLSRWDDIKMANDLEDPQSGLGGEAGDQKYLQMMQQHKNMTPPVPQPPAGPGTFGMS